MNTKPDAVKNVVPRCACEGRDPTCPLCGGTGICGCDRCAPDAVPHVKPALTRADELFIAGRLMSRARHSSKKLSNANGKNLHPGLVADMHADIAECTRLALLLQAEPTCLVETASGEPTPRCDQFPACICGGPKGGPVDRIVDKVRHLNQQGREALLQELGGILCMGCGRLDPQCHCRNDT